MAPSIQDVELKNMPWWWMVSGSESEFVACRTSESVELTSMGGGLGMKHVRTRRPIRDVRYLRPRPVDADRLPREEAVRVNVVDVGDVPPELLDASEGRGHGGEDGEGRARSGPHCGR